MTYEERLERDLERIRDRIRVISRDIETALTNSVHALLTSDRELAYSIILGDCAINRASRDLLRFAHSFVARHLPSAGHLRFISSVMRLVDELERIGDYAVTVCREVVQLQQKPPATILRDIDLLADQTFSMYRQAVRSFLESNSELARGTAAMASQIGRTFDRVFQDLVSEGASGSRSIEDLFGLLMIFNRLGRVASRSKNVCESTIFAVTGETKLPKQYRVLFVDQRNDRAGKLAEAIGRKAFSQQGTFSSCGWEAAEAIDTQLREFLDSNGLQIGSDTPSPVPPFEELSDYHVIVGLQPGIEKYIPRMPFHVVLQQWDPTQELSTPNADLGLLHQWLTGRIEHLMETLWGHGE